MIFMPLTSLYTPFLPSADDGIDGGEGDNCLFVCTQEIYILKQQLKQTGASSSSSSPSPVQEESEVPTSWRRRNGPP